MANYYPAVIGGGGVPQYTGPASPVMPLPVHGVEVASVFADPANAFGPPEGCIGCTPPLGEVYVGETEISPGLLTAYSVLSISGTVTGAYHGYKRNKSIGWAMAWAFLGGMFPVLTIPISLAQGFGKPKGSK